MNREELEALKMSVSDVLTFSENNICSVRNRQHRSLVEIVLKAKRETIMVYPTEAPYLKREFSFEGNPELLTKKLRLLAEEITILCPNFDYADSDQLNDPAYLNSIEEEVIAQVNTTIDKVFN